MSDTLRIAMAQLNLCVGDIAGNLEKHIQSAITARDHHHADVIVFPELSLTGYPPEDLLLRPEFIAKAERAFQTLVKSVKGIYCLVGHPQQDSQTLFNACSLIHSGEVLACYRKQYLPNYGVFDECRYFSAGKTSCVVLIRHIAVGLVICEDAWHTNPIQDAVSQGARLILSPNASPFEIDKHEQRIAMLSKQAKNSQVPIVYVNNVGGQDELIFDGGSMLIDAKGNIAQCAGFFEESLAVAEIQINDHVIDLSSFPVKIPDRIERVYRALKLSVRDYIEKNHFPGVLIGVSGGIDSALTLAIAVDALGPDRVRAVIMPSRYTADISVEDAKAVANALRVSHEVISIEPVYESFLKTLAPVFKGKQPDISEENIQARCRGVILMGLSNKFGSLVLTTGNRSELAVGYCTLYGDMAGGFAVLKDVPKTQVYELAHYRNQLGTVIPKRTIERAPTAELAPEQKDEDSLPPYSLLDRILEYYLNQSMSLDEITAKGIDRGIVAQVIKLVRLSEYKRRQSPIGPRIHNKSFGRDWRYPVTKA